MDIDNFTDKEIRICLKYPSHPMTFEERDEIADEIQSEAIKEKDYDTV